MGSATVGTCLRAHARAWCECVLNASSDCGGGAEQVLQEDTGKECSICFDEFVKGTPTTCHEAACCRSEWRLRGAAGDVMSIMECFCMFHKACIEGWFTKHGKRECPVHHK